jgi:gluconolactonase
MQYEVVASGYGLVEGPTIDGAGGLFFTDVLGGGVFHCAGAGATVETVVPKRRGVGGLALHADGGLVGSGRDIVHARDGETRTLLHVDGVAGWNDLTTDVEGAIYAGALRFAVFDPDATPVAGEVWRIAAEGEGTPVLDDVVHANGIALSPDGSMLYCSDTRAQCVHVLDIASGARRALDMRDHGRPDGMAIDTDGDLWLALVEGGVGRFAPDGTLRERLAPPSSFVTSVCFDGDTLYIVTANNTDDPERRGCVFRTQVAATGSPLSPARV